MKLKAQEVLDSEVALPSETNLRCSLGKCTNRAAFQWPSPILSDEPLLYCKPCLEVTKKRLRIALGFEPTI